MSDDPFFIEKIYGHMKEVIVDILEQTPDSITLKIPFVPVPVKMNYPFYQKRLEQGYFKLRNETPNDRPSDYLIPKGHSVPKGVRQASGM